MATGTPGVSRASGPRRIVYALGLCVYCTSWTFFGSVGLASSNGLDFLPIYIGPMLVFGFGWPLVARVARLARAQNITSIADFLAARYGKSEAVAAVAAIIAVIGVVPYIALQLKAISATLAIGFGNAAPFEPLPPSVVAGPAGAAASPPARAVRHGVRHAARGRRRAPERPDGDHRRRIGRQAARLSRRRRLSSSGGCSTASATCSSARRRVPRIRAVLAAPPDLSVWVTLTLLSSGAMMLLPRQFHVAVVENRDEGDIRSAAVVFPLYLLAINFFVVPLAIAGLILFPDVLDRDVSVMALPIFAENGPITPDRHDRRPVGGDRHGRGGIGRAVDHGVEQSRPAAAAAVRALAQRPGADWSPRAKPDAASCACGAPRSSSSCCSPSAITG